MVVMVRTGRRMDAMVWLLGVERVRLAIKLPSSRFAGDKGMIKCKETS